MNASLLLQYIVIAVVVLASAGVVAQKQFPAGVRRLRIALAIPLVRENQPHWLRSLGKKIAPVKAAAACGDPGCDGCGK